MGIFLFIRDYHHLGRTILNKTIKTNFGVNIAYTSKGKKKIFNTES